MRRPRHPGVELLMAALQQLNFEQAMTLVFVFSSMATGGLWMGGRAFFRVGL